MENVESNDSFFLTDAISGLLLEMVDLESDITSRVLADAKDAVLALSELLTSAEITNSALDSLQKLLPLVPEEKREEFGKIVAPEKSKEWKLITAENIKWLLGIIIPILVTIYLHQLPDKNAEESLQLQREELAVKQEENELRRENMELFCEFFDYIKENGIGFSEQISTLPEQFDTFENDTDPIGDLVVSDEQRDNQPK